jgi:DNA-binding response OmpR family regulator
MQAVARERFAAAPDTARVGPLERVEGQPYVLVDRQVVELTRRELEVLGVLWGRAGEVVPREELYERIWGMKLQHNDRSLDVYIRRLRRKLEAAKPGWTFIDTRHRIGYRLNPRPLHQSERPGRRP